MCLLVTSKRRTEFRENSYFAGRKISSSIESACSEVVVLSCGEKRRESLHFKVTQLVVVVLVSAQVTLYGTHTNPSIQDPGKRKRWGWLGWFGYHSFASFSMCPNVLSAFNILRGQNTEQPVYVGSTHIQTLTFPTSV